MIEPLSDAQEGFRDAMLVRAGILKKEDAHPFTARVLDRGDKVTPELAETFVVAQAGRTTSPTAGLSTDDFQTTLADAMRRVATSAFQRDIRHRKITKIMELPNFKEHPIPKLDALMTLEKKGELFEVKNETGIAFSAGLLGKIDSYEKQLYLSRALQVNDEVELFSANFLAAGVAASRLEKRLVYSLLESNPVLSDGESMFHVDHGNLTAKSGFNSGAVGEAMGLMRKQSLPGGEASDLEGRFLLVPAELELDAISLVHKEGLSLEVIASPLIAVNQWYLLADPDISPVIALLLLDARSENIEVAPMRTKLKRDGQSFRVGHDAGVVAVGRMGAIRGHL
jgi:hypothetical protein